MIRRQNKNQNQNDDDQKQQQQVVSSTDGTTGNSFINFYMTTNEILDMIRIFLPKIVLELFGSAGAIWGFFEAVGLRTPATVWFWRPVSLAVGGLFLQRYCLQIIDHYHVLVAARGRTILPSSSPTPIMHSTKDTVTGMEGADNTSEETNDTCSL
jgi:hypothetical protein